MKKRLSYGLLLLSVCFLAFSIYYMADYIKASISDSWTLEEIAQSTMGVNIQDVEVDQLIEAYAKDPSIKEMIHDSEGNKNYETIANKLGVENYYLQQGVVKTDKCSIITLDEDQSIRYKWSNQLGEGTLQWIIKDITGKIVFENSDTNISVQGDIPLTAGDYFVYLSWNVENNMSYNLYISEK